MELECKYDDTENVVTVTIINGKGEGDDNCQTLLFMLSNLIRTYHADYADLCQRQLCEKEMYVAINCPRFVAETIETWVKSRSNVSGAEVGIFEELGRVDAMLARAKRLLPPKELKDLREQLDHN